MNNIMYYFLKKLYDVESLDKEYIDNLYNYYECGKEMYDYQINITKDEFQDIIEYIYRVLQFRISEEEFYIVCENYIKLLIADAIDGDLVDAYWFIDHLWYLSVGLSGEVDVKKYKDCIPFMQKNLIKKFKISETLDEKIKRKIYTGFMIR